jgi:hypothetical protein
MVGKWHLCPTDEMKLAATRRKLAERPGLRALVRVPRAKAADLGARRSMRGRGAPTRRCPTACAPARAMPRGGRSARRPRPSPRTARRRPVPAGHAGRRRRRRRERGDAKGRTDRHLRHDLGRRIGHASEQALRKGERSPGVRIGSDDHELVASQPAEHVTEPKPLRAALGDRPKKIVPDAVAEPVVDLLEAVEVERDQGERLSAARAAGEGALDLLLEEAPVVGAGQSRPSGRPRPRSPAARRRRRSTRARAARGADGGARPSRAPAPVRLRRGRGSRCSSRAARRPRLTRRGGHRADRADGAARPHRRERPRAGARRHPGAARPPRRVRDGVGAHGGRSRARVGRSRRGRGRRGVPEELQARIFDAFFTTKPVDQGTGLGLDIAQRIVVRHHGELRLRSEPGDTASRCSCPSADRRPRDRPVGPGPRDA